MPDTSATTAALVIQMSADMKQFRKEMRDVTGFFDKNAREIEKRQAKLRKTLETGFGKFTGLDKVSGAVAGLTAVGIVGGLGALVNKSMEVASSIGETAIKAGVSTKKLQELRFAAAQSGSSFETMDAALITFNKNFGEYINTGSGKAAPSFKALGIDKMIDSGQITNAEQAVDAFLAKVAAVGNASQRAAYLAGGFGKEAGPQLAEMVSQGTAAIAALERQANALGIVLDDETIRGAKEAKDKLDALFKVIEMQGVAAIAKLAPEIGELSQQIIDGMPRLINYAERWADFFGVIRMSPMEKLKGEVMDLDDEIAKLQARRQNGGWQSLWGLANPGLDKNIANLQAEKADKQAKIDNGQDMAPGGKPVVITNDVLQNAGLLPGKKLTVNDEEAEKKAAEDAKKAAEEAKKVQDFIEKTGADAKTAAAALQVAEAASLVDRLRGQEGYYEAVMKQIDAERNEKISAINAEEAAEKQSLSKLKTAPTQYKDANNKIESEFSAKRQVVEIDTDKQKFDAGIGSLTQQTQMNGVLSIQQYSDQIALIGLMGGALARAEFMQQAMNTAREKGVALTDADLVAAQSMAAAVGDIAQKTADMTEQQRKSVEVADDFRSSLAGIIVNFHSARSAAASFLNMLAQRSAMNGIEALYGKQGTPLGGASPAAAGGAANGSAGVMPDVFKTLLAMIPAFAGGTDNAPGGLSLVGEKGPELVNLPKGAAVTPNYKLPDARNWGVELSGLRGASQSISSVDNRSSIIVQGNADSAALRLMSAMLAEQNRQFDGKWREAQSKYSRTN